MKLIREGEEQGEEAVEEGGSGSNGMCQILSPVFQASKPPLSISAKWGIGLVSESHRPLIRNPEVTTFPESTFMSN